MSVALTKKETNNTETLTIFVSSDSILIILQFPLLVLFSLIDDDLVESIGWESKAIPLLQSFCRLQLFLFFNLSTHQEFFPIVYAGCSFVQSLSPLSYCLLY
ncbi:hypothetical protein LINPERPRIM_LOCUS6509 [Linum perenne]